MPPDPALLESMRSIGYTVESAVADIIDNSVAANASNVEILFSSTGDFEIAVVDDGSAMGHDDAVTAMRLAATSPTKERGPNDLGRFGLGLKTASLSQCRTLTLVTKKAGVLTALRWSLDHVIDTGDWALIELSSNEIQGLLGWVQLAALPSGTLVHWGDLDQLEMTEGGHQTDLGQHRAASPRPRRPGLPSLHRGRRRSQDRVQDERGAHRAHRSVHVHIAQDPEDGLGADRRSGADRSP